MFDSESDDEAEAAALACLRVYAAGHVMLDPYPSSGSLAGSLQALGVGLPVVTYPSTLLGGRLTRAMYRKLGYGLDEEGGGGGGVKMKMGWG